MSLHPPPPNPTRDFKWWRDRLALDVARVGEYAAQTSTILPKAIRPDRNRRTQGSQLPPNTQSHIEQMGVARSSYVGPSQPVWDNPAITSEDIHNDPFVAHGATGTRIIAGIISGEEYNEDLQDDKGLWVYHQMWMSDGEVSALLQVLMLPLLEATWSIQTASDDEQDVAIAQFVQDNLFGGMQKTWHETLEFILLSYFRDGFAVMEKVWSEMGDDGLVRLRKLAPRISRSIWRWYPDDDDELDRIQQRVWKVDKDGISGTYIFPVVESRHLVRFTRQQEGNNFKGVSVLRAAYKHWFFKDLFEKIMGTMAERASGIPHFQAPPGGVTQRADMDAATQVAESLHAGEKVYVVTPAGWTFDFVVPQHGMDLIDPIKYHSLQMVRSVLAQFLDLEKGGSYAMSMDISTFFLQALHAVARYIRDTFDRHVIRDIVDLNFDTDRYPSLEVDDLDKRDIDKWLAGLARVLQSGWLSHTVDTENAIRSMLGLPDLPPDATPLGGGAPSVTQEGQGPAASEGAPGGLDPTHGAVPGPETGTPSLVPQKADATVAAGGVEYRPTGEAPEETQYAALARGSLDEASGESRQAALLAAVARVLRDRPSDIEPERWERAVLSRAADMAGHVPEPIPEPVLAGNGHAPAEQLERTAVRHRILYNESGQIAEVITEKDEDAGTTP